MKRYEYRGNWYSIKELSEISGIAPATIGDRLRRGYTVEQAVRITATKECVEQFCEASWYGDWIGLSTTEVYEIYWKWAIRENYSPLSKQGFSRQLFKLYPNLKVVPITRSDGCYRIIRER